MQIREFLSGILTVVGYTVLKQKLSRKLFNGARCLTSNNPLDSDAVQCHVLDRK